MIHKHLCLFVKHSHQCINLTASSLALHLVFGDGSQNVLWDILGNIQTAAGNGTSWNKKQDLLLNISVRVNSILFQQNLQTS